MPARHSRRAQARFAAVCALVAVLIVSVDGRASPTASGDRKPQHRFAWEYPRFRIWQYVTSALVSGTNLYFEFGTGPFPDRRFNGALPLDVPVRNALRADTARGRARANRWSDYFWQPVQYFPLLIDGLFVPLVLDEGNTDVAWQMNMVNWQAIGLAFFLTRLTHVSVGRARPSQYGCSEAPGATNRCGSQGPSFLSGHTSMAATGAGLTCSHHAAFPLFGGGWGDPAICALLCTATLVNGALRIHADRHWLSDVVAGYALGYTVGLGLPWLLHYGSPARSIGQRLPMNVALLPFTVEGGAGLQLVGDL